MPKCILHTLQRLVGGLALVLTTPALAADVYQGKTLTVIVGYAPGGGVDASARRASIGIDPTRLTYIGSPGAVSAAGFVHARTGITSYSALKLLSKPVTFGALGATTPTAMAPAL